MSFETDAARSAESPIQPLPKQAWWTRLKNWILVITLLLTVIGARFALIDSQAIDVPFWDQWGAELEGLILPYWEGTLSWQQMVSPHNEHRILLSRLLALGLFLENGQWDGKLEMGVNVFIQAAVALAMFLMGRRLFRGVAIYSWWLAVAAAFSLPFGYENTLVGFQSPFFMMNGLSLLLFWAGGYTPRHPGFVALALLVFAVPLLFTLASGFLAAASMFGVLFLGTVLHHQAPACWRSSILPLLALLLIMGAGFLLLTEVPRHEVLRPSSLVEFCYAAVRCFSWPFSRLPSPPLLCVIVLLLWAPFSLYFGGVLWCRRTLLQHEFFILSLGTWVALQMLAVAASRGAGAPPPLSRYADTVVIGLLANFLALRALPSLLPQPLKQLSLTSFFSTAWVALAGAGVFMLTFYNFRTDLPNRLQLFRTQQCNVANFIADNNPAHFINKLPEEAPYPHIEKLIMYLRDPAVRAILPFSIRESTPIEEDPATGSAGFTSAGLPLGFAPVPTGHSWWRSSFDADQGGGASRGQFRATFDSTGRFPYLGWMVAGQLEENDPQMTVQAPGKSREKLLAIANTDSAWQSAFTRSRAGSYEWLAKDNSRTQWLAFTAPKEIGHLSYYTLVILPQGRWLLILGLGLFALMAVRDALRLLPYKGRTIN